jgi:hypothetical protein
MQAGGRENSGQDSSRFSGCQHTASTRSGEIDSEKKTRICVSTGFPAKSINSTQTLNLSVLQRSTLANQTLSGKDNAPANVLL